MNASPSQFLRFDAVPGAADYEIDRSNAGVSDGTFIVEVPEAEIGDIFAGLTFGTTRTFKVRARNEFGAGPYSVNIGITLISDLTAPGNLRVE